MLRTGGEEGEARGKRKRVQWDSWTTDGSLVGLINHDEGGTRSSQGCLDESSDLESRSRARCGWAWSADLVRI